MVTTITQRYHFVAGHFLPLVPAEHKCRRQHGHNYMIEVTVMGDMKNGWVLDFWELDRHVKPLIDLIDHRNLNDIDGLWNPTAENIAQWFLEKINSSMLFEQDIPNNQPSVSEVRVYETPDCWATYKPNRLGGNE
jgi:6-pyruvoyltetrahydropterin/6-carboxytetrahydropterin synthase